MKYPVTAAVLGTGYMGKQYIRILQTLVNKVIVCTTDEAAARTLTEENSLICYKDYNELFEKEDIDFVAVCLPSFLHYDAVMNALNHGISVLCEKPFASSVKEAAQMTKTAKMKDLHLMVAHCIRFTKEYEYLKRCIQEQRLGNLLSLHLFRHHPIPMWSTGNWLMDPKLSGGFVRDAHIHDTDILLHILGMPDFVYTSGNTQTCSTIYGYETDYTVTASGSWRIGRDIQNYSGFDAVFTQGVIKCENGILRTYTDTETRENLPNSECFPTFLESKDMVTNEIRYFLDCLTKNRPVSRCLPEDSLNTMFVIEAEEKSLKEGRITRIALSGGREPGLCI